MLKIGYFADGKWGHNAFEKLNKDDDIEIKFICVRFDSVDQKFVEYSKKNNIPLLKYKNINSKSFLEIIKVLECDLLISMSFNQIFKKEIIHLTKYGIINCHAGKLPFYRGRNILNWAIINDETEFGITVHYVDDGIDTGDIIRQKCFPITDKDNYKTLLELAFIECPNILYDVVVEFKKGKPQSYSQKKLEDKGFYCGRRIEGDEIINWNQKSRELFNFIRAICSPGPMATTSLNGVSVKINSARIISGLREYKGIPGQILGKTVDGYLIKTKDTYLEILEIQSEAKIINGDRFK